MTAGTALGHTENYMKEMIAIIKKASVSSNSEFLLLASAIIYVESQFNPDVVSSKGAIGLMQVMPIAATEAEKQCPKAVSKYNGKWSSPEANIRYGTCLLQHYQRQVQGSTFLSAVLYNGGYKQLERLAKEGTLTEETLVYVLKVHQFIRRCQ